MKQKLEVMQCAAEICKALQKGVLLTSRAGDRLNTMTIGWGMLGIEWNKPIFIAYVRESRFTREFLDETGEFTVNIPQGENVGSVLSYCGRHSGRDTQKLEALGLTPEEPEVISVPGIRQLPLTLECRVLMRQVQQAGDLPQQIQSRFYPEQDGHQDRHIAYYGEIVAAYRIE